MGKGVAIASHRPIFSETLGRSDRVAMRTSTTAAPSDEELAGRAQQGCAESFDQLMRRFQAPVLHFLQRRGAGAEAEDLLQETFLRAYANLSRYRSQWRFATWLFTIARRVSITYHRRPPRPEGREESITSAESNRPGPLENAMMEDNRQYLWSKAVQILSEEETTALWLHYGENLDTREIANVLGRTRVAVKTMLFRSRQKLIPLLDALTPEGVGRDSETAITDNDIRSPLNDAEAPHA